MSGTWFAHERVQRKAWVEAAKKTTLEKKKNEGLLGKRQLRLGPPTVYDLTQG